jgi:hypothetical protein
MRKINVTIIIFLTLCGCEKSDNINIVQPKILMENESPKVFDTISLSVSEEAEIDDCRIKPDHYEWSILNKNNEIVYSSFKDTSMVKWIPDSAGYFVIKVMVDYHKNKSIAAFKEAIIHESTISLQKKLIGKWVGTMQSSDNLIKWELDVTFNEIGHYFGKQYNGSSSWMIHYNTGPFGNSYYFVNDTIVLAPSEDVPCTRFLLDDVKDNKGFGRLSTSREFENKGIYSYECSDKYDIKDLVFEGNKKLRFSLQFIDSDLMALNFKLIKVE